MTVRRVRADALAASRAEEAPPIPPTPERAQHGQMLYKPVSIRHPTTIASGVQALQRSGAIGNAEVTAAERFQRDYTFGIEGVRDPAVGGRARSSDAHDAQIARAEALTRHREIADVIGEGMTQWLIGLVVLDLSFEVLAVRYMRKADKRTEMRGRLTTLLIIVTQQYAAIDRRKKRDNP
jgi:hypothetical protein